MPPPAADQLYQRLPAPLETPAAWGWLSQAKRAAAQLLDGLDADWAVRSSLPGTDAAFIRYLELQPARRDDDPLVCTMHTAALQDAPPFEAISYVWGSAEKNRTAVCNGRTVAITTNLHDTLCAVRPGGRSPPRVVWADGICINQQDDGDKAAQVVLMGRLYSRATRVLICLGRDGAGLASAAASLIADVEAHMQAELDRPPTYTDDVSDSDDRPHPFMEDARWPAFSALGGLPWFGRGWVVQEAGLAGDARMLWGGVEVGWRSFTRVCYWLLTRPLENRPRRAAAPIPLSSVHMELYVRRCGQDAFKTGNGSLLANTRSFAWTLHRARCLSLFMPSDRVYAFLGVAGPGMARDVGRIKPDYGKPSQQVYLELAKDVLWPKHGIELLSLVQHDSLSIDGKELQDGVERSETFPIPSWVPRWDKNLCRHDIKASWFPLEPRKSWRAPKPSLQPDGRTLCVPAVILDVVSFQSSTIDAETTTISSIQDIWELVTDFIDTKMYYGEDSRARLQIFWNILTLMSHDGDGDAYMEVLSSSSSGGGDSRERRRRVDNYHDAVLTCMHSRSFVVTERGLWGAAPGIVQQGDLCAIIFGMISPVILRRTQGNKYKLLGEAWFASKRSHGCCTPVLGENDGKDWVKWDVQEEMIFLV